VGLPYFMRKERGGGELMWVEHMPPQTTATGEVVLIFNVGYLAK